MFKLNKNLINYLLKVGFSVLFALSKCYVKWLGSKNSSVHFCDGLGGLLRTTEADETETLRSDRIFFSITSLKKLMTNLDMI
jgi:hypothetical protein